MIQTAQPLPFLSSPPLLSPALCSYCVYLFHELPEEAQRAAAAEMARVVKPGGIVVLTDSVQSGDRDAYQNLGNFGDFQGQFLLLLCSLTVFMKTARQLFALLPSCSIGLMCRSHACTCGLSILKLRRALLPRLHQHAAGAAVRGGGAQVRHEGAHLAAAK